MKTKVICILICIAFLIGCLSEVIRKNDLMEMELHGNVKSIRDISYKAEEEQGKIFKVQRERETSLTYDNYILFNEKGNKTEEFDYESDGSIYSRKNYKYDSKGNKVEVNKYFPKENTDEKEEYLYNKNGKIDFENYYYNGELSYKRMYLYSDGKNLIEVNSYNYGKSELAYNQEGKLDFVYRMIPDGYRDENSLYDENENEYAKNMYSEDGSLYLQRFFRYDNNGREIECSQYGSDGSFQWKFAFEYDEKGNQIESIKYNENNTIDLKHTYSYDENGNQIQEKTCYDDRKYEYSFDYQYDINMNWISQIKYFKEAPIYIVEREIEYYESHPKRSFFKRKRFSEK